MKLLTVNIQKPRYFEVVFVNIMNNWPSHVTKTRHLASRQNRPRLCLHFRIIKRASNWPKQAGPQNASNSILKRKQRNLLDNNPHSKEAQSRIGQTSTPNATKRSTDSTNKQAALTRMYVCTWRKTWDRQSKWSIAMTSFAPEEFAPEEFFRGVL